MTCMLSSSIAMALWMCMLAVFVCVCVHGTHPQEKEKREVSRWQKTVLCHLLKKIKSYWLRLNCSSKLLTYTNFIVIIIIITYYRGNLPKKNQRIPRAFNHAYCWWFVDLNYCKVEFFFVFINFIYVLTFNSWRLFKK